VTYAVSTPVYEGPFDLLLHLIAKEQVNLFEVSISGIVDAFLVEIEALQALDLDVATEFLLIASTLIELKLRKLLPERASIEMEEELALLEERDLLLAKLLEYQTFRHAAEALRRREAIASKSFPRTNVVEERFSNLSPDPLSGVNALQLRAAFIRAVTRAMMPKVEPKVSLSHVTDVRLTVAEAVADLARALPRLGRATFRSLIDATSEPMEIIVRFLATLELFKQGWVELDQPTSFGDLMITWCPDGPEVDLRFLPQAASITIDDPDGDDEPTLDDLEDADVEAELDLAIAEAEKQRRFEAASVESGTTGVSVGGISITVDDYEG
jgi:segregation and condensation protein A